MNAVPLSGTASRQYAAMSTGCYGARPQLLGEARNDSGPEERDGLHGHCRLWKRREGKSSLSVDCGPSGYDLDEVMDFGFSMGMSRRL